MCGACVGAVCARERAGGCEGGRATYELRPPIQPHPSMTKQTPQREKTSADHTHRPRHPGERTSSTDDTKHRPPSTGPTCTRTHMWMSNTKPNKNKSHTTCSVCVCAHNNTHTRPPPHLHTAQTKCIPACTHQHTHHRAPRARALDTSTKTDDLSGHTTGISRTRTGNPKHPTPPNPPATTHLAHHALLLETIHHKRASGTTRTCLAARGVRVACVACVGAVCARERAGCEGVPLTV